MRLQQSRDPFEFSAPGEIGFVVCIVATANRSVLVYIPTKSATRLSIWKNVRPNSIIIFDAS